MMKKTINQTICLVLTVAMLLPGFLAVSASDGTDNKDVERYRPFNSWAVEIGIKHKLVLFTDANTNVKRWETANILYLITQDTKSGGAGVTYNDLGELSESLQKRIGEIGKKGLISGYEDGSFRPLSDVTRAEFATLLDRSGILSKLTQKNYVNFTDTQGHWAQAGIKKIADMGILAGKSQDTFCPDEKITIQEIMVILDRLAVQSCIDNALVTECMTDTFECKRYNEDEAYIIETIYSKFDEVQNKLQFYWHNNNHYDVNNWQGLAAYQDLVYALYFIVNGDYSLRYDANNPIDIKTMNRFLNRMYTINDKFNNLNSTILFEDLCRTIPKLLHMYFSGESQISFFNITTLEGDVGREINEMVRDQYMEDMKCNFPLKTKVSKIMLNYIITKLFENWSPSYISPGVKVQTNITEMPSSYYDYPLIIKGIPNEFYEIPFKNQGGHNVYTPKQSYQTFCTNYSRVDAQVGDYFKVALNVNYQSMNVEEFVAKVDKFFAHDYTEHIRRYAQWVIDNEIILEGKAYAIPATIYQSDIAILSRVVMDFKVISAKENKNLLLADFQNQSDVWYTKQDYYFAFDKRLAGMMGINWEDVRYTVAFNPIVRDVYYNDLNKNEL